MRPYKGFAVFLKQVREIDTCEEINGLLLVLHCPGLFIGYGGSRTSCLLGFLALVASHQRYSASEEALDICAQTRRFDGSSRRCFCIASLDAEMDLLTMRQRRVGKMIHRADSESSGSGIRHRICSPSSSRAFFRRQKHVH